MFFVILGGPAKSCAEMFPLVDLFLGSRSSWVMRDRPLAHWSADLVSDRIYLLYQFMCIFGFEKLVGRKLDFIITYVS